MSIPDWSGFLADAWGPGTDDSGTCFPIISAASNVVIGQNPPFTIQDFFEMYPKWGGTPLSLTNCTTTENSPSITVSSTTGIKVGNPVYDPTGNIPDGTFVQSIPDNTHLVLTNSATQSASALALTVYNAPLIPIAVLLAYIALATASLVQARWLDSWNVAMGWFIAHYATLYARADGNPNSTVGQAAAQGLANGIQVAKSVGDVSVNYESVKGIEDWGTWNLTSYGQLLATMAKGIGNGPLFLY